MICFLTTPGHGYSIDGLVQAPSSGPPRVTTMDYHALLRATALPFATYVFADIERLYPWERRLAAECFRGMRQAGLVCLNDPARVPTRYALLRALAREGINPFGVYAAEDRPEPRRFPVFVRCASGHDGRTSALLRSQAALDEHLRQRAANGESLSDCMVVEYVDARRPDGLWQKCGTFRVGEALHYDHTDYRDGWIVRSYAGSERLWTQALMAEEHEAVLANATPPAVRRVFEIAGIEWGRADHAATADGHAVFEVNTNPHVQPLKVPGDEPYELLARRRLLELLAKIDSADGPPVAIEAGPQLEEFRRRGRLDSAEPTRP